MSNKADGVRTDWRERKRAATRRAIQEHAIRLFLEKSYEATTVEEIAKAAQVSQMTFFRYFPTKEHVATDDDYDPMIARLVETSAMSGSPADRIHRAFVDGLSQVYAGDKEALLARMRLVRSTPALRGRLAQNQLTTRQRLIQVLAEQEGRDESDLSLQVLVDACLAAAGTALFTWVEESRETELPVLIDRAFVALKAAFQT
jgi:AcrR family transcriptional regulator